MNTSLLAAEPLTGAIKLKNSTNDVITETSVPPTEQIWQKRIENQQQQQQQQQSNTLVQPDSSKEIHLRTNNQNNEQLNANRHEWEFRTFDQHQRPRYYREMPYGYRNFFLGGIHYFFYNELWYVMRNGYYEEVTAPRDVIIINGEPVLSSEPILTPTPTYDDVQFDGDMQVLDFNGLRYYYKNGRYYRLDINGNYLEVPPPR